MSLDESPKAARNSVSRCNCARHGAARRFLLLRESRESLLRGLLNPGSLNESSRRPYDTARKERRDFRFDFATRILSKAADRTDG